MASKLVTDRQKNAEAVVAVGEIQADAVGKVLGEQHQAYLREGETMPDCALLMRLMVRGLQAHRAELVAADEAHESELADDAPARQARDAKVQTLFGRMVELREVLQGLYGAEAARAIMPYQTPTDPVVLSRFAGEVIAALGAVALPAPRIAGATVDTAALGAELQKLRDELDARLTAVAQEAREAQATQVAKNRAMEAYDRVFAGVATAMNGMLQLAGEHELASRVRPSRRRPGRTAGDAELVPQPIAEPIGDPATSGPAA